MQLSNGELPGKPKPNPSGREFVNSVVQRNGESSAQCNTLKAQNLILEEENVTDATTALGDLNIVRGTSSSRGGEISTELEEPTSLDQQQLILCNQNRRFREMMSRILTGTCFKKAWDSQRRVCRHLTLTRTDREMNALWKPLNYPHTKNDDWTLAPMKWFTKKNDPGKFRISCTIMGKEFTDCLCNTGFSITIIPNGAADRIGITIYQESDVSLWMANTTAIPVFGKVHTILVRIGNHIVRTNFHVVCTRGDRSASIILRRPFLATVGTVIDLPRKRVTFTHNGPFCINPAIPTHLSLHEATLERNSKRKPKSRRKRDYKRKKAAAKANEGIVMKGPVIKARGETSRSCSNNVRNTQSEYCTDETTIADVKKFGDTGDPTLTRPELELSGVSTTSDGRSVKTASLPYQS